MILILKVPGAGNASKHLILSVMNLNSILQTRIASMVSGCLKTMFAGVELSKILWPLIFLPTIQIHSMYLQSKIETKKVQILISRLMNIQKRESLSANLFRLILNEDIVAGSFPDLHSFSCISSCQFCKLR